MKKAKWIFLACFTIIFIAKYTTAQQSLGLGWAKQIGGGGNEKGRSLCTDPNGNLISTGYFTGTVDFNPGSGTFNLTAASAYAATYIQKLDANGNFLWARQFSNAYATEVRSVTTDKFGNIYVCGEFKGTIDFDPGTGVYNLTGGSNWSAFILKLDSSGHFVWAKQFKGTQDVYVYSIKVSKTGYIHTAGTFFGTADFDPGSGSDSLTSAGGADAYVHKMDASGNRLWVRQMSGTDWIFSHSTALDDNGNVYTTGSFNGTVDFDPWFTTHIITSTGNADVFVQKLDSNGFFVWANKIGSNYTDRGYSIVADSVGNCYVAGSYTLYITSSNNIMVAKMNPQGNIVWTRIFGGTKSDIPYSIALDSMQNVYTTGYFGGTVDFDPDTSVTTLSAGFYRDLFIHKMDSGGVFKWVTGIINPYESQGMSMCVNDGGDIHVLGDFEQTLDVDPGSGVYNLSSFGNQDVMLLKFGACAPSYTTDTVHACDAYTWINGLTYTSNNYTAQDTLVNQLGCDSIVTLNLTISSSSIGVDTVDACGSFTWIDGITYTSSNYTATDTLINANGCDSIVRLHLTLVHINNSLSVNDPSITAYGTNMSYQWLDCDAGYAVIPGETGQSFTASANGNYAVEFTLNACKDTSLCVPITGVGLNHPATQAKIKLYPNPTDGKLYLDWNKEELVDLKLYDMQGKLVYQQSAVMGPRYILDIKSDPGVYMLEVKAGDFITRHRITKQ